MTTATVTIGAGATTKKLFLSVYRLNLIRDHDWARDETKLNRFMTSVAETLAGRSSWNHNGDTVTATWRELGNKGKPTLKALRALPEA